MPSLSDVEEELRTAPVARDTGKVHVACSSDSHDVCQGRHCKAARGEEEDEASRQAREAEEKRIRERKAREKADEERKAYERHLRKACETGRVDLAERLLKSGVTSSGPNTSGTTPLHEAAYAGHVRVCELLLEYRADASETDKWGVTALHHATSQGENLDIVRLLIANAADVNAMNQSSMMPLDNARKAGNRRVVQVLVDEAMRVADVNRQKVKRKCGIGTLILGASVSVVTFCLYFAGYVGQDARWLQESHVSSL